MQLKLLLVGDEQGVLEEMKNLLLSEDKLEIMTVPAGMTGVAIWADYKPDLTLLDMPIQELDGMVVLRHMKATGSLPRHPVILLTESPTHADRAVCREIGAFDIWGKPLEIDRLRGFLSVLRIHRRNFGNGDTPTA